MLTMMAGAYSLLKLTLWCTIGGTIVTVAKDEDFHKFVKGVTKSRMKKVRKFDIGQEHATVIGLTQHGKTYATVKTLDNMNEAVLFFNTNHTPLKDSKSKWVTAEGKHSVEQILYCLTKGYKVNYLPDEDIIKAGKQLNAIVNEVYNRGRGAIKFRFVIDEVHLFWMMKSEEGKKANLRLATTALGRGIPCMWLSQRGALVDNTIYTQSTKHIIFALGKMDEKYLKEGGFPVDEIKQKTGNQKYIFCEFDQKEVKGGFMIG